MTGEAWPGWVAPVAAGHRIANVREMRTADDGTFYFVNYAIVLRKNGFAPNDWDRFVLDEPEPLIKAALDSGRMVIIPVG